LGEREAKGRLSLVKTGGGRGLKTSANGPLKLRKKKRRRRTVNGDGET